MKCPNISHPDWIALVNKIGEEAAWTEWIKNGEEIPNINNYNSIADELSEEQKESLNRLKNFETLVSDIFIPGFTPYLQNETVNHLTEYVLKSIKTNPDTSLNEAIKNYTTLVNTKILTGNYPESTKEKYKKIVDNISSFRELVKNKLERIGILNKYQVDPEQEIEGDDSGDKVSDSFYWKDDWVFKFDAKSNAQKKIKEFLLFIPKAEFVDGEYVEVVNYLNTISYMPYDEVFEDLKALLADVPPVWIDMKSILEGMAERKPWIYSLLYQIDNYEDDQQQLINQFVSTFSSTHSNFKTLIWNNKTGAYDFKLIDTDQNAATKSLTAKWQDNFNQTKLLTFNSEDEAVVNKSELDKVLQDLKDLQDKVFLKKEKNQATIGTIPFLKSIGIEINEKTLEDLETGKVSDLSFEKHFTSKKGLFYLIKERLNGKDSDGLESDEVINPMINNSAIRQLALTEVRNNPSVYSNSLINGEGNTVYSYSFNKFLTKRFRELKDKEFVDKLTKITFHKPIIDSNDEVLYKTWLWQIQNNPLFLENFEIGAFDTIRKQTSFDNGIKLNNMSDIDLELTQHSLFQNKGRTINGLGRVANYLFTTPGKTTAYVFTAPALDINISWEGGNYKFSKTIKNALYNIALSELSRIKSTQDLNIKTRKYQSGSKHFYFFPQLNDIKEIWNTDGTVKLPTTKIDSNTTVEDVIRKTIEDTIRQNIEDKINDWQNNGFIQEGKLIYLDESYKQNLKSDDSTNIKIAAIDYIVNNTLFNFNLHQSFIGDPAIYFKNNIQETWDEVGKRLAAMIAPGRDLALESQHEEFISVKAKDRKGNLALNFDQLEKVFIKEFGEKKANALLEAYKDLNGTDAQEWITLREKITVLYKQGTLDSKTYNSLLKKLNTSPDSIILNYDEISLIFQPDKPVYVNSDIIPEEDVVSLEYVKSSSIPLIPQFTKGLEIDKVRKAMEKLENEEGIPVRIAFDSATKTGGVASINIWNEDGTIKNKLDLSKSAKRLKRSGMRIQQDVPNDPDYEFVVKSSQATKLAFDNALNVSGFEYKNSTVDGKELYKKYNKLHQRLFEYSKNELHKEILDPITGVLDISKVQKLLLNEAKLRDYSPAELASLNLLEDNTFEYPFWAITSSKKYEALLTSLYSNNIVRQKMHGNSYVLMSEEGLQGKSEGIIYTKAYDPSTGLKPMRLESQTKKLIPKESTELLNEVITEEQKKKEVTISLTDEQGSKYTETTLAKDAIIDIKKQYKQLESLIKCLTS